jgi:hypothetical protein
MMGDAIGSRRSSAKTLAIGNLKNFIGISRNCGPRGRNWPGPTTLIPEDMSHNIEFRNVRTQEL